jgi:hypothetical protein
METRDRRPFRFPHRAARAATLTLVALAAQAGCGREFYREWANQDASESVFEKSRDPRWRLDMFSIEPPALSRFADPYDPDRPPAPPDDYASEQTSPVPQWPDNRLLVPPEGTAYLDMLDNWDRNHPVTTQPAGPVRLPFQIEREKAAAGGTAGTPATGAATLPTPPAAGASSPFRTPATTAPTSGPAAVPGPAPATPPATPAPAAKPNSGTNTGAMSPLSIPGTGPSAPAATAPTPGATTPAEKPRAGNQDPSRDAGVVLSAFQETGLPVPVPPSAPPATPPPLDQPRPRLDTPSIGMDPKPGDRDLSKPDNPRPDLTPDQYRASETLASEISSILVPGAIELNEAEAAGHPRSSHLYVVTMEQAFTLALINSRAYQFNLENVYLNALAVTQQRFVFMPQFFAGLSPLTAVATGGGPSPGVSFTPNPVNQFLYQTAETGQQLSSLNLGAVAGAGKVFDTGARLITGFASQLIFNFTSKSSAPTVKSYLPLTLVQPFLRGGGRAVTLEALTLAERNLLYSIRAFAKFRQEFVVYILVGGTPVTNLGAAVQTPGFSGGGSSDPSTGYINVLEDLQLVENAKRNIGAYEKIKMVYTELIKGESSGLTKLQLDQVDSNLQGARQTLVNSRTTYRTDLDNFKLQMGLPPDTPLVLDRRLTRRFKEVYDAVDEWQRDKNRNLEDLPRFADSLPKLQDVVIDGRSVLGVYSKESDAEDKLEDLLLAGERTALEHRLDQMNNRAALYDAWRAIKVAANALQGYFNVALTNQFITPPTTNNPFAFVDQAKSFSLVLNAELPLVRMTERNAFRSALIGYQRARRNLQSQEDTIKVVIRNDIRNMHQYFLFYEIAKRNFVLLIRQKDQAFEQIVAPPQGTTVSTQGAVQTNNLLSAQSQLLSTENSLITLWYQFQTQRLALYRDLGIMPYDEWEAFHELFPDEPISPGASAAALGAGATRAAAARPEPAEDGRVRR